MMNSYLGNIYPFPLVNRNVKEELNMSTTPDQINDGAIQYGRHWLHLCTADALSSLILDQWRQHVDCSRGGYGGLSPLLKFHVDQETIITWKVRAIVVLK